ncbi:hypothetical protein DL95DRAFT_302188, partial [Leptodontidium sp. 2 PMI_412]
KKAQDLFRQVMKTIKKVLREEYSSTLTYIRNLAITYCRRWKEAEELEVQVMDMMEVLGQEHPDTLTSMNNLA